MEQKVVGPLTFRRFIIISIGVALSFAAYFLTGDPKKIDPWRQKHGKYIN